MKSLHLRQAISKRVSGMNILLWLVVILLITEAAKAEDYQPAPLGEGRVVFDNQHRELLVEIAGSEEARARGLMFRQDLGEDEGMLFVFPDERVRGVWMKNTLLSLDILFISSDGRIVSLLPHLSPCVNEPCDVHDSGFPVRYMLEVNAGYAARWDIRQGDRVSVSIKD